MQQWMHVLVFCYVHHACEASLYMLFHCSMLLLLVYVVAYQVSTTAGDHVGIWKNDIYYTIQWCWLLIC